VEILPRKTGNISRSTLDSGSYSLTFKRDQAAEDSTRTAVLPNPGRPRSKSRDTGTVMAGAGNSPGAGASAASAPGPRAVVSGAGHGTSETGGAVSSSDSDTSSSQSASESEDEGTGVDRETCGQFKETVIPSDEEDEITVIRSDWMPLEKRRKMARKRIKQSTSYMELLEDRVAFLESHVVDLKPDEPVDENEMLPARLMRREPNRLSFEDFELARQEEGEHVLDIQIRDPAEVGEASGAERAEKMRLNSVPVLKILEKLTTKAFGNSYIFLRPFRFLMRHRDILGGYLAELEKVHGDKDACSTGDEDKSPAVIYEPGGGGKLVPCQTCSLRANALPSLGQ